MSANRDPLCLATCARMHARPPSRGCTDEPYITTKAGSDQVRILGKRCCYHHSVVHTRAFCLHVHLRGVRAVAATSMWTLASAHHQESCLEAILPAMALGRGAGVHRSMHMGAHARMHFLARARRATEGAGVPRRQHSGAIACVCTLLVRAGT